MLKKTIKYTDYNGVEREEDFYFNLSKAELVEMELSVEGGFVERMQEIIASEDGKAIMQHFREIILKAYGVRSDDGRRFIKSKELSEEFSQTEAYSVLFVELATEADKSAIFVNGLVPADLAEQAKAQAEVQRGGRPQPQDRLPASVKEQHRVEETVELPASQPVLEDQPAGTGHQAPDGGAVQTQPLSYEEYLAQYAPPSEQQVVGRHAEVSEGGQAVDRYLNRPPHESGQQDQA